MKLFIIAAVPLVLSEVMDLPDFGACDLPLDRGTPGPNPSYKYYFDKELQMCLRYRFEGSGGGRNSFVEESLCRTVCILADAHTCGANLKPTGSCAEWENWVCPAGTHCLRGGLGIGLCCDSENEKAFSKEYTPTCAPGYDVVTTDQWFGKDTMRGRRCDHQFCPDGSQCFNGKWIAHCCTKAGNGPISDTPNNELSPYQ